MQIGDLRLQQHVIVVGAGNIAGTAGPGAATVDGCVHGCQDIGVLTHTEIIVGAPDRDLAYLAVHMHGSPGEFSGLTFQVGEYAIAALIPQRGYLIGEETFVIHVTFPR